MRKDWIGILTGATCDEKFEQFSNTVDSVLDEIVPVKKVKISSRRRYVEPWMTRGLENAGKMKLKLYQRCIQPTSTEEDRKEYTTYCNVYNNLKRKLQTQYYQNKCEQFKENEKPVSSYKLYYEESKAQRKYHILYKGRQKNKLYTQSHSQQFWQILFNLRVNPSTTNCSWHDICTRLYT